MTMHVCESGSVESAVISSFVGVWLCMSEIRRVCSSSRSSWGGMEGGLAGALIVGYGGVCEWFSMSRHCQKSPRL